MERLSFLKEVPPVIERFFIAGDDYFTSPEERHSFLARIRSAKGWMPDTMKNWYITFFGENIFGNVPINSIKTSPDFKDGLYWRKVWNEPAEKKYFKNLAGKKLKLDQLSTSVISQNFHNIDTNPNLKLYVDLQSHPSNKLYTKREISASKLEWNLDKIKKNVNNYKPYLENPVTRKRMNLRVVPDNIRKEIKNYIVEKKQQSPTS